MSLLSENTERKAIRQLSGILPIFGRLDAYKMSAQDARAAREAENLIRGIIETNACQRQGREQQPKKRNHGNN